MKRPTIHLGTPNGPACGAHFTHDGITGYPGEAGRVTCARCYRTRAYQDESARSDEREDRRHLRQINGAEDL